MSISFSFSKCDIKTRINKGYTVRKTQIISNKQWNVSREEKVNYLHDFCSRPSIWILHIKALANGFNICFNILSILLNGNVESVCHPLSTVLKGVETMLNRCWKSLKAFKLRFNIRSTFLLFSGMFGMLKRSWSRLPRSFNIVEQAHEVTMVTMDAKTEAKQNNFVYWL